MVTASSKNNFEVENGKIEIAGQGLDLRNIDKSELITRGWDITEFKSCFENILLFQPLYNFNNSVNLSCIFSVAAVRIPDVTCK